MKFQHDNAPSHVTQIVKSYRHICHPKNSSDLTKFDYFILYLKSRLDNNTYFLCGRQVTKIFKVIPK